MASNLPPGVTEGMIPGNRPEDIKFDRWCEDFTDRMVAAGFEEVVEIIGEHDLWWSIYEREERLNDS